ncbi:MAG TPA: hypothetical protein PLD73_07735 [Candidatus Hydrogenedentes bacterium]|jgi:ferredoxin--NADP+ reductase|nr:hypothetical protein [Candidatus Hydrogenedentota bacterium]
MASLAELDISKSFVATVLSNDRITPESSDEDIRNIVIELDAEDFSYHVGDSIGLLVPGPDEFGNEHILRLYTIAGGEKTADNKIRLTLCVKRCFYIDDYSGEKYQGKASNYFCDRAPGDELTMAGPFQGAFTIPDDENTNLLMVGLGTGIAPFRAFVRHIYDVRGGWKGKVRLFFGAKTGLEMLYMNDERDDFANYYDEGTFKAFEAVSPRPAVDAPVALDKAIEQNAQEVWDMVRDPDTYVFVSGHEKVGELLNQAMAKIAGSDEKWQRRKAEMKAGGRWMELMY